VLGVNANTVFRALRTLREEGLGLGDFQPLLAQVGRWLVYVGDGMALPSPMT
jgi:hypothetical protein